MHKLEKFINYLLSRGKENSTWAGVFALASYYGFDLPIDHTLAVSGLIMVLLPNTFDLDGNGTID